MQETQHGAQAKVDRHAAIVGGAPGSHLPPGTDGYSLVFDSGSGMWVPEALPGSGVAASKDDPLGFGIPWSVDPRLASSQSTVGAANRGWWYRVTGAKSGCTKIGISVVTQSGNVCAGIYANSGAGRAAAPAARLATTGSVACPGTGYRELDLTDGPVNIKQGDWLFFAADNITASFDAAPAGSTGISTGLRGYADAAFPAPAAAPAIAFGNRGFALIGV